LCLALKEEEVADSYLSVLENESAEMVVFESGQARTASSVLESELAEMVVFENGQARTAMVVAARRAMRTGIANASGLYRLDKDAGGWDCAKHVLRMSSVKPAPKKLRTCWRS
jgi:hypothetical protein